MVSQRHSTLLSWLLRHSCFLVLVVLFVLFFNLIQTNHLGKWNLLACGHISIIFLINNWCGRAQPTVGHLRLSKPWRETKPVSSAPPWPLRQPLPPGSFLGFPPWWTENCGSEWFDTATESKQKPCFLCFSDDSGYTPTLGARHCAWYWSSRI